MQQSSDTVRAQQIGLPMVTKRLSLTETSVQNLLTARAKSLLHTSKQKRLNCHDVTVTMSDILNTVQKRQSISWKLNFTVTNQKWPDFKNGHEMANLATLVPTNTEHIQTYIAYSFYNSLWHHHPDCYASCRLIFLPCICFASIYASTAAKSYSSLE